MLGIIATDYKFVITTTAALIAAVLSCLASQPGDSLLSAVNKQAKARIMPSLGSPVIVPTATDVEADLGTYAIMRNHVKDVGFGGLCIGTKLRLLHVSIIVVSQLLVYDYIKVFFGIAATGASH